VRRTILSAISGTGTAPQSYRFYLAKWLEDNVPEGLAVFTPYQTIIAAG
jgi:hypothetical protein